MRNAIRPVNEYDIPHCIHCTVYRTGCKLYKIQYLTALQTEKVNLEKRKGYRKRTHRNDTKVATHNLLYRNHDRKLHPE